MLNTTVLLILFLPFVGLIFLQLYLSKSNNRFVGLILPILQFLLSLFLVFGMVFYSYEGGSMIVTICLTLFLFNIPTLLFLLIYAAARSNRKKNKQLDKMNIQDL